MPITNLQEKFLHELADIYDAEHRFLEAQQQMLEEASAQELQGMIQHRPYRLRRGGLRAGLLRGDTDDAHALADLVSQPR
jgi:hypothetical protein